MSNKIYLQLYGLFNVLNCSFSQNVQLKPNVLIRSSKRKFGISANSSRKINLGTFHKKQDANIIQVFMYHNKIHIKETRYLRYTKVYLYKSYRNNNGTHE